MGKYLHIYCHNQHNEWVEYLSFFEQAINNNYNEATGYTPIELEQGHQPYRFRKRYNHKPDNQNVSIPLNIKIEHAKNRTIKLGNKRIERFNRTLKLQHLKVGDTILLKTNPVGRQIENTAKISLDYMMGLIVY